jgi:hypothetical protein
MSPCHEQTRASNDDGQFSARVGQWRQSYPDRIRFAKVVKVGFGVSWPLVHVHASFEMPLRLKKDVLCGGVGAMSVCEPKPYSARRWAA